MAIIFEQDLDNDIVDGIYNIAELGVNGTLDFTFDLSAAITAGAVAGDVLDINGQTVTLSAGDITSQSLVFSYDLSTTPDGPLTLNWAVTDTSNGGVDLVSGATSTAIDQTAPTSAPSFGLQSDTGESGSDGVTNSGLVAIDPATVDVGATVEYTIDGGLNWTVVPQVGVGYSFSLPSNAQTTVEVRQVDAAGNASAPSPSQTFTSDSGLPTVGITDDFTGTTANSADGDITFTFTFSEDVYNFDFSDITVANGTAVAADFTAVSATEYTLVVTPNAGVDGNVTVVVSSSVANDLAGNQNLAATGSQDVDTDPYDAPIITGMTNETGVSLTDNIVNTASNGFTGTVVAADGSTVRIYLASNDQLVAQASVTSNAWSTTNVGLPDNDSTDYYAVVFDAAGNPSAQSATFTVTVDTDAPADPGLTLAVDTTDGDTGNDLDGVTSDATVDVTGLETDGTWEYRIDDGSGFGAWVDGTGNTSLEFADDTDPANDGSYTVEVRQMDVAGNTSNASSATYVLDTTADADATALSIAFVNAGGDTVYNMNEAVAVQLQGLDSDATAEVTISSDGTGSNDVVISGVAADGTITLNSTQMGMLADGALTVSVVATDDAGNTAAPVSTNSYSLDTMSPTLLSAVFSDVDGNDGVISDADTETGEVVVLTLTFSEAMDVSADPTVGLDTADLTETGTRSWNMAGTVLTITYTVADNGTDIGDIAVDISGAQDVAGNSLAVVSGQTTNTSIDTLNPLDQAGSNNILENADGLPVSLGSANGDIVATFATNDGVTYAFDTNGDAGGAFAISNNTLVVADETLLDRESNAASLTVNIIATDDAGNETAFAYIVNLDDADDAPVIDSGTFAATVTERADVTTVGDTSENNPTNFGEFGSIHFSDDDIADSHSVSVTNISTTNTSGFVGVFLAGLADPANGDGQGRIDWTFGNVTPAPAPNTGTPLTAAEMDIVDALADGETIVQVFRITVTDFSGTTPLTTTQDVTITIAGTNDAPVIEVVSGTDSDSDSLLETDAVTMADGTLSLSDVDATDVVAVTSSITASDISGTFGGTLPLSVGELDNMFTTSTTAVAGGAPNDAVISWDFASANAADFDFLADGETLVLEYTVTATDDSGTGNNNDTQTVTITITGTNDAPTIDAIADEGVTETTDTSDITATINATFTDVDLNDVGHMATITDASIAGVTNGQSQAALTAFITSITPTKLAGSDSGSLAFAFSAASTDFDYLAQGETATITYTVTLNDGDSGTTTQTFDVIITGTNDLPTVADTSGAATEDGAVVTINFGAITDVDLSNTHTYQIVSQPTEGSVSINATDGTQFDFDPGADFQDLAAGETRNVTFTYTATDNDSGVSMPATARLTRMARGRSYTRPTRTAYSRSMPVTLVICC